MAESITKIDIMIVEFKKEIFAYKGNVVKVNEPR
jgi:hypothetical protein